MEHPEGCPNTECDTFNCFRCGQCGGRDEGRKQVVDAVKQWSFEQNQIGTGDPLIAMHRGTWMAQLEEWDM